MVKSSATSKTGLASAARSDEARTATFAGAAIGMGWQLAVVVLLPIVGGYKLDLSFGTMPVITLIGLVLAMVGSILVIRHALKAFGNFDVAASDDAEAADIHKERTL